MTLENISRPNLHRRMLLTWQGRTRNLMIPSLTRIQLSHQATEARLAPVSSDKILFLIICLLIHLNKTKVIS